MNPRSFVLLFFLLSTKVLSQSPQLYDLFLKALKNRAKADSGLYYANEAYVFSKEIKYEPGEHISKMYAGLVYFNIEETDTASILLYDALPYLKDDSFEKGMAHWYIGKVHTQIRDLKIAKEHLTIAAENFYSIDSIRFLADVYNSLGILQGKQSNYLEALEWITKAYHMKLDNGLEATVDGELNNIAVVYMRMRNYKKAIEYVTKAIQLNPDDSHTEYSTLGGIYNYMQMLDSAILSYQISLKKAENNQSKVGQSIALSNLSNIYYQRKEYHKAIELLNRASVLRAENKKSQFNIFIELGKSYRGLGMYDSASYFLRKGYKLAVEQSDKVWADEAVTFLGYLLSEQQKFDSAFYYLTLSLGYRDSLNNERIQEIFADQRVKLETAHKQYEIEELEKKNEIAQYKQRSILVGALLLSIIGFLAFINFRAIQKIKQKKLVDKNLRLEQELERNKTELSNYTLNMIYRKNSLEEVESQLQSLEGIEKQKIKNVINVNRALEKDWENFQKHFSQVHTSFFENLRNRFPNLTQSEIRLSALIRMNLANHEIASLLNIESKSVRMARYRLRKKFDLEAETDLNLFVHGI